MKTGEDNEGNERYQPKQDYCLSDSGDILQPAWIRRFVCFGYEVDRIVLDNRRYLLFHIGIIFWIVLFLSKKNY